jgi:hypothetical protein
VSQSRPTSADRYGVFSAHGFVCYLCGEPLNSLTMEVDHVLPQWLLTKKAELGRALSLYGLPATFRIESFENWAPACHTCNRRKRGEIVRFSPGMQIVLDRIRSRASLAERLANDLLGKRNMLSYSRNFRKLRKLVTLKEV